MGLAAQRDRVTEYAREQGWALVEIVEEAASGGVKDGEEFSWIHRPVLRRLVDRAAENAFDVLLVAKLDRLSRDYATLIVLERRLQRHGVEVVSTAEANGDGAIAEFVRGQFALVAQLERAMILERVTAGKAKKMELGRHIAGRAPYGYESNGGVLTPVDALMPVVRGIFQEAKAGDSPGRIARRLSADGIVPPQSAAHWGERAVRLILRNSAYVGERYGVKDAHPAVVTSRLFNAAQRALDQRASDWRASRGGETQPPPRLGQNAS